MSQSLGNIPSIIRVLIIEMFTRDTSLYLYNIVLTLDYIMMNLCRTAFYTFTDLYTVQGDRLGQI
jgi:hypothetical protein